VSFKIEGGIKIFQDKQNLTQYITTKPPLQKILKEIPYKEHEKNIATKQGALLNLERSRQVIRE
jgi:hypothetical protein